MSSAQAGDGQLWRQMYGSWQDWKQLIVEVPLPALLLLLITLWWYMTQYLTPKKPPGPWSWPIVGNLPTISWSKKLPHQTLQDLAAKYGGFMYLRLGMQVITSVYVYHRNLWPYMCRVRGWQLSAIYVVRRFESLEMLLMERWVVISRNLRRNMLVPKEGIEWNSLLPFCGWNRKAWYFHVSMMFLKQVASNFFLNQGSPPSRNLFEIIVLKEVTDEPTFISMYGMWVLYTWSLFLIGQIFSMVLGLNSNFRALCLFKKSS